MIRSAALLTIVFAASFAEATRVEWEFGGQITDAENLTFAIINGVPRSQNPEPSDLPLPYTGTLVVDTGLALAELTFEGSFTSPTRSYSFDITSPNAFGGFEVLDLQTGRVQISDQFAGFDLSIVIAGTGRGEFSFRDPGAVPTSPAEDVFATGFIQGATFTVIPEPMSVVLAGVSVLCLTRRRRA